MFYTIDDVIGLIKRYYPVARSSYRQMNIKERVYYDVEKDELTEDGQYLLNQIIALEDQKVIPINSNNYDHFSGITNIFCNLGFVLQSSCSTFENGAACYAGVLVKKED